MIKDTPSGDSEIVSFELAGQQFMAISAGPYFKFNPSISLMVACSTAEEVNSKWAALSKGGTELMPLGEYPFSKRYGWIQDRYGLSWQLMLADGGRKFRSSRLICFSPMVPAGRPRRQSGTMQRYSQTRKSE